MMSKYLKNNQSETQQNSAERIKCCYAKYRVPANIKVSKNTVKNIPSWRNQTQLKILTHRKKTSQKNAEMKKIPKSGNNSVNIVARAPA